MNRQSGSLGWVWAVPGLVSSPRLVYHYRYPDETQDCADNACDGVALEGGCFDLLSCLAEREA
jgi:hypothetical protein